jgi:hypothetical protein
MPGGDRVGGLSPMQTCRAGKLIGPPADKPADDLALFAAPPAHGHARVL